MFLLLRLFVVVVELQVQGSSVQPALVSIAPCMLATVLAHAAVRGGASGVAALWAYEESDSTNEDNDSNNDEENDDKQ
jgi:hypothetical protein